MISHYLFVVTKSYDSNTKVLGVYDANYLTLDDIVNYYKQSYTNIQQYYDGDNAYIDILDNNDMLESIIKVTKTNTLIKNK